MPTKNSLKMDLSERLPYILVAAFLVLITLLLYWPSLSYDFIETLDDDWLIINNPAIKDLSWKGLKYMFLEDTLEMHYHPITYLSLAFDYHFFGLNATAMKVHNLILHLLCAGLIIVFFKLLGINRWVALMTVGFFLIHPLQMESVVWAICRRQVLLLFFSLLALISFVKSIESTKNSTLFFLLSIVFYSLATLSKATAFILPFLFILVAWYQSKWIGNKKLWIKMLIFIPLLIFFFKINIAANDRNFLAREFSYQWWYHIFFFGYSYTWYWIKMIIPIQLSVFYPIMSEHENLPLTYIFYTIISVSIVLSTIYAWIKGHKLYVFIIGFYSITIVMKLNRILLPPADIPCLVADRYFYFSSPVMLLGMTYTLKKFLQNKNLIISVYVILVIFYIGLTRLQIPSWENDYKLVKNIVDRYPNEEFFDRLALIQKGNGDTNEAYNSLRKGDSLTSDIWIVSNVYFELEKGMIYFENNDFTKTIECMQNALDLGGAYSSDVFYYMGISKLMLSDSTGLNDINTAFEKVDSDSRRIEYESSLIDLQSRFPNMINYEILEKKF